MIMNGQQSEGRTGGRSGAGEDPAAAWPCPGIGRRAPPDRPAGHTTPRRQRPLGRSRINGRNERRHYPIEEVQEEVASDPSDSRTAICAHTTHATHSGRGVRSVFARGMRNGAVPRARVLSIGARLGGEVVSVEDDVEEEEVEEVEVEPMAGMKLDRKAREVLMSMADKKPNPPNTPSRVGSTLAQYSSAATTTRWQNNNTTNK